MACRRKRSSRKKKTPVFHVSFSDLRKENESLRKTLAELNRQHSEQNQLLERFLSLETARLVCSQQLMAKGEMRASSSEHLIKDDGILTETTLKALEENKQWLDDDQQREAFVRAILDRLALLEMQLNVAKRDEENKILEMQGHYERLLQKAKDELQLLRGQVSKTQQDLVNTQDRFEEKEREVEELKQQLEHLSSEDEEQQSSDEKQQPSDEEQQLSDEEQQPSDEEQQPSDEEQQPSDEEQQPSDEEQQLSDETKDLHERLHKERRKSANFQLQANIFQKFMVNRHLSDQRRIANLERQIKVSSQDLEDERQNCSYLKKQMVRILRTLRKNRVHRDQDESRAWEVVYPPYQTSSPYRSLLNESSLECPKCLSVYPAKHYRDLLNHLETCLD